MTTPSPSAPLTREELEEAKRLITLWLDVDDLSEYPHPVGHNYRLMARAFLTLEQHAEAMAVAAEKIARISQWHGQFGKALAAYRAFRPRTNPTEGEK